MAFLEHIPTCRIQTVHRSSASISIIAPRQFLPFETRRSISWWWNSVANDSSSSSDDSFQRHLLRKQRILRYKNSKAVRRRALWDRDPSHGSSKHTWPWQVPEVSNADDEQASSSTSQPSEYCPSKNKSEGAVFDDFNRFKSFVDKDPFAAVFGTRLFKPQKPASTSWSSFVSTSDFVSREESSRIPRQPESSAAQSAPGPNGNPPSDPNSTSQSTDSSSQYGHTRTYSKASAPTTATGNAGLIDEYEYDPISMRKVLKTPPTLEANPKASKPLFDPLFAEKGVDVPVKRYKPARSIDRFTRSDPEKADSQKSAPGSGNGQSKGETSRLTEIRKLRAAKLGNSIDTTAQYHGKWISATEKAEEDRKTPTSGDDANELPSALGSASEEKANNAQGGANGLNQKWLSREGFGMPQDSQLNDSRGRDAPKSGLGRIQHSERLQPSLDRLPSTQEASDKLNSPRESPLASEKQVPSSRPPKPVIPLSEGKTPAGDDLSRRSDGGVRYEASISPRQKQHPESTEMRRPLQSNLDSFQKQNPDDGLHDPVPNAITESSKKLSEAVNSLWRIFRGQQKFWPGQKGQQSNDKHDSTIVNASDSGCLKEPNVPESDDKGSCKVGKTATRPVQTFTPSQEVLDVEKERESRTLALRKSTLERKKLDAETRKKEKTLGEKLKAIYEDEYGLIPTTPLPAKATSESNDSTIGLGELATMTKNALKDWRQTHQEISRSIKALQTSLEPANAEVSSSAPGKLADSGRIEAASKEEAIRLANMKNSGAGPQPQRSASQEGFPLGTHLGPPLLYKVLAYDSSTLQ